MARKLRLGLISSWVSRSGSGVYEAVVRQALAMRGTGEIEPAVFGLEDEHSAADAGRLDGIPLTTRAIKGPRFFGFAPGLVEAMQEADLDVLHLHGIWMYPSRAAERWSRATGKPVVISPHGMLDPWILSRGRWKKALARSLYERQSWKRAALFHALTETEAADIRKAAPGASVKVIANGVTAPAGTAPDRRSTFVFLSRIHPKKNAVALVKAWASLGTEARARGYGLAIAGFGDAEHVAELEAAIAAAGEPSIRFLGPVFGAEKDRLLLSARYVALPSFSEGLPMAILEAWAAGAGTIMSSECNLPIGYERGAAIASGHDVETIAAALRTAFEEDDAAWSRRSAAAMALAAERFSPDAITQEWTSTYAALAAKSV